MNFMNGRCERSCPYILSETERRKRLGEHIASLEQIRAEFSSFPQVISELDRDLGSTLVRLLDEAGLEDDELIAAEADWQTEEKLSAAETATTYGEFAAEIDADIAEHKAKIDESLANQELLLGSCWRGPKKYSGADGFVVCRSAFKAEYEARTEPS